MASPLSNPTQLSSRDCVLVGVAVCCAMNLYMVNFMPPLQTENFLQHMWKASWALMLFVSLFHNSRNVKINIVTYG